MIVKKQELANQFRYTSLKGAKRVSEGGSQTETLTYTEIIDGIDETGLAPAVCTEGGGVADIVAL